LVRSGTPAGSAGVCFLDGSLTFNMVMFSGSKWFAVAAGCSANVG